MPKYEVTLARELVLTSTITVIAATPDQAKEQAKEMFNEGQLTWYVADNLAWETDTYNECVEDIEEI